MPNTREKLIEMMCEPIAMLPDKIGSTMMAMVRNHAEMVADIMIEQGVEIPVPCAECKFWRDAILDGELKCCTIGYYMTKGSDYCSFGKRSDEE